MVITPQVESRPIGPSPTIGGDWQWWELKIPLGVAYPATPTETQLNVCKAQCERLIREAEEAFRAKHPGSRLLSPDDSFFGLLVAHGLASHQSDGQSIVDSATLYMKTPPRRPSATAPSSAPVVSMRPTTGKRSPLVGRIRRIGLTLGVLLILLGGGWGAHLLYDGLLWYTQYEACLTETGRDPAKVADARRVGASIEAGCVQSVDSHWPEGAPILPPRPKVP